MLKMLDIPDQWWLHSAILYCIVLSGPKNRFEKVHNITVYYTSGRQWAWLPQRKRVLWCGQWRQIVEKVRSCRAQWDLLSLAAQQICGSRGGFVWLNEGWTIGCEFVECVLSCFVVSLEYLFVENSHR